MVTDLCRTTSRLRPVSANESRQITGRKRPGQLESLQDLEERFAVSHVGEVHGEILCGGW
jgi:hypothetical protein